jgi:3-hydroxyisobutyrate dehydrogenase-like beta-hydroxyacid dehydrogenase
MRQLNQIGFIGLGTMGKLMATHLLEAGYALSVSNRSSAVVDELAAKGARACQSPMEVARNSEVVILCLPDSRAVEQVTFGEMGLVEGFEEGHILIDMTSAEPESTRKIAQALKEKGVQMMDAPVSGGPTGAQQATLTIMAGGEASLIETCGPVLRVLGEKIYHVGEVGAGHTLKAVNNLLLGTILVATCEAVTLGVKAGLDPQILIDVMSNSSGRSYALNTKFVNHVLKRDFNPGFKLALLDKDMRIALGVSEQLNFEAETCADAEAALGRGLQLGFGEMDYTSLIQMYETASEVIIK